LEDANAAIQALDEANSANSNHVKVKVVESTEKVHNLVVCTLCSCYPVSLLGLSPSWYKSREYRIQAVERPKELLKESFGLEIPSDVDVQVHDSNSELRHVVLPRRPAATEGWSEEELIALVTRDTMIGVAIPEA
jgi:nitrile hydratase